jgi:hypothetical protein
LTGVRKTLPPGFSPQALNRICDIEDLPPRQILNEQDSKIFVVLINSILINLKT